MQFSIPEAWMNMKLDQALPNKEHFSNKQNFSFNMQFDVSIHDR